MSFVYCRWACIKCQQHGTVRAWSYRDESSLETARRHAEGTRASCVAGCGMMDGIRIALLIAASLCFLFAFMSSKAGSPAWHWLAASCLVASLLFV